MRLFTQRPPCKVWQQDLKLQARVSRGRGGGGGGREGGPGAAPVPRAHDRAELAARRAPNFGQEASFPLWAYCPLESDSLARLLSLFSFSHPISRQGKALPVQFIDVLTKSTF